MNKENKSAIQEHGVNKANLSRKKSQGKTASNVTHFFLALTSALLMILAFPEFNAFYLAFFALVPLFIVLEMERSLIKVVIWVEVFVLVFYLYLLYWIETFHPLALPGVLLYLLLIYPIPFIFYRMVKRSHTKYSFANVILLSCILTLFENFRNFGFMKFPYGNIAYSQYEFLSFIQISDIIGPLGISFILYFFNACLASFILKVILLPKTYSFSKLKIIFNRMTLAFLVVIAVYIYGDNRLEFYQFQENNRNDLTQEEIEAKRIDVALIQPWFDYNKPWNKERKDELYDKLTEQTLKVSSDDLDLIVWPESAILDYYDYQIKSNFNQLSVAREFYDFFKAYGKQFNQVHFLVGSSDFEITNSSGKVSKSNEHARSAKDAKTKFFSEVKKYNSSLLINHEGEVVSKSGKRNLVAFAEYFPYKWVFNYVPILEKFLNEAHASNFSPYLGYETLAFPKGNFGSLICYDSVFPELSRVLVLKGAKFLVVITNDAWSYSVKSEVIHYSFSIFRAIENRRHVIRVGNAGVTSLILPSGKTKGGVLDVFVEDSMVSEFIPNDKNLTFYSLYGNIILYIIIFFFMINYFGLMGLLVLPWRFFRKVVSLFRKNKTVS